MTTYLLDTSIISKLGNSDRPPSLTAWMAAQNEEDLFIAALSVAEVDRIIGSDPDDVQRDLAQTWFSGPRGPQAFFAGRILPFDEKAAVAWARLMPQGERGHAAPRTSSRRPDRAALAVLAFAASWHASAFVADFTNFEDKFRGYVAFVAQPKP